MQEITKRFSRYSVGCCFQYLAFMVFSGPSLGDIVNQSTFLFFQSPGGTESAKIITNSMTNPLILLIPSWGKAAMLVGRGAQKASENPEEAASTGSFIVSLIIFALIAGLIGGIAALIAKFALDANKEDTSNTFLVVGGIVLAILVIGYFIA